MQILFKIISSSEGLSELGQFEIEVHEGGEAYKKPYSQGNKKFATQGEGAKIAGGNIHKDGIDHPTLKDPKIGSSKKQFSPTQEDGQQNGKDFNDFVMVTNSKK